MKVNEVWEQLLDVKAALQRCEINWRKAVSDLEKEVAVLRERIEHLRGPALQKQRTVKSRARRS